MQTDLKKRWFGLIIRPKKTALLLSLLAAFVICLASPAWASEKSASEVAKELANPNTNLGFMAFMFDYKTYDGDLANADDQDSWTLSFQPSLPCSLTKSVKLFARPLIPIIIDQPVPVGQGKYDDKGVELGDIGFDVALGTGFANGVQVIGGMTGSLDTASDDALGSGQTRLGPEFFIGQKTDWGFYGALFTHVWDVAGDDYSTSITGGQYFYTINLQDAWQIQAQPTWAYNHNADSGDKLTLPLGIGVAKTVIVGKTPLKFSLQYWYFIESPDTFGPEHLVRFQVAPVVPLPW